MMFEVHRGLKRLSVNRGCWMNLHARARLLAVPAVGGALFIIHSSRRIRIDSLRWGRRRLDMLFEDVVERAQLAVDGQTPLQDRFFSEPVYGDVLTERTHWCPVRP